MKVSKGWAPCPINVHGDGQCGNSAEKQAHRAWDLIIKRWPDARVSSGFKVIYTMDETYVVLEVTGVDPEELLAYLREQ